MQVDRGDQIHHSCHTFQMMAINLAIAKSLPPATKRKEKENPIMMILGLQSVRCSFMLSNHLFLFFSFLLYNTHRQSVAHHFFNFNSLAILPKLPNLSPSHLSIYSDTVAVGEQPQRHLYTNITHPW